MPVGASAGADLRRHRKAGLLVGGTQLYRRLLHHSGRRVVGQELPVLLDCTGGISVLLQQHRPQVEPDRVVTRVQLHRPTQLGWLEYQTGRQGASASLIDDARAKLGRAVQLDPGDYAVRLYLGTVLLQQDGDATGAVEQYRQFLADNPPAAVVQQAAVELRAAYQQAGVPVPTQVGTG